jgi:hypothetical protein
VHSDIKELDLEEKKIKRIQFKVQTIFCSKIKFTDKHENQAFIRFTLHWEEIELVNLINHLNCLQFYLGYYCSREKFSSFEIIAILVKYVVT